MSLMAEQIVEEWLNRRGFFTIRGARVGTGEIDLLAIRPRETGMECWHYEVQGSLRPVSYICPAQAAHRKKGISPFNAKRRQNEDMQVAVDEWVKKKFHDERKRTTRLSLCKGSWQFGLVVGNVKFPDEIQAIEKAGVTIIQLANIIPALEPRKSMKAGSEFVLDAAGGNDLIELVWARQNLKNPR